MRAISFERKSDLMRRIVTATMALCASAGSATAQSAARLSPAVKQFVSVDAPVVALTHVRVIDGSGGPIKEDQTVVIANGKIQSVGAANAAKPPAGARVMDLAGHTVIPGMVGLHDHMLYTTRNRIVQISATAQAYAANLIVIGKQGRSRLAEYFVGGTTRHTIARAHCDVAVVPGARES